MIDWQPIETAPEDTRLLCYRDGFAYFASRDTFWSTPEWTDDKGDRVPTPTHWAPEPEGPK